MIAKEEPVDAIELTKSQKKQVSPTVNAQDYDDPQAGPSGIKQEVHRNMAEYQQNRCYTNVASSSDDDSDDDREIMRTTSLWRSRGTFNLNQTSRPNLINRDLDDDSLHNRTTSAASSAAAAAVTGGSGNNYRSSPPIAVSHRSSPFLNNNSNSLRSEINRTTSEILTAPDLQLDWLSDSSVDSEDPGGARKISDDLGRSWRSSEDHGVVYVPLPSSSPTVDEANAAAEAGEAAVTTEPSLQIDLTISDDEDVIETTRQHSSPFHLTVSHRISPSLAVSHRLSPFQARASDGGGGAESRSLRHQSSPVRVPLAINRLQQALYDGYHNRESHVGHLNCRSAYSTCDCLEAASR